jgi:hypothetical protein
VENGPAAYVWTTSTGIRDHGYIYCWLPDKECRVSMVPRNIDTRVEIAPQSPGHRKGDPLVIKKLQKEFDDLHDGF